MQFDNINANDQAEAKIAQTSFAPSAKELLELNQPAVNTSKDTARDILPALELNMNPDNPTPSYVKDAVSTFKEKGPAAALETMRNELSTFEKEKFDDMSRPVARNGAGFDQATATEIARKDAGERWEEMKQALLKEDPKAMEKLKVAYLTGTLKAMSDAGGHYGNLNDDYGVSGKSHFAGQISRGANPMVRELAGAVSKEYDKIADPKGTDDDKKINSRELSAYRAEQAKTW
jgi:hypothetical protein